MKNEPLGFGLDFGLTPTVVVGQPVKGKRRIYAAFTAQHAGIKQLIENEVLPWLNRFAPWTLRQTNMIYGCYDISGQTSEQSDIERDPISIVETLLPGLWYPGPVRWEPRLHTIISAMNHHVRPGEPSLEIDPVDGAGLIKALSGRWHYATDRLGQVRRDVPKKPNHPWEDYGDACIYWLWSLTSETQPPATIKVETQFSLNPTVQVESSFSL